MSTYDDLRSLITQLADRQNRKERGGLSVRAMTLVRLLEAERPATTDKEALDRSYEAGALKALEIVKEVRGTKEAPLKNVAIGDGYMVLNGLLNYGQAITSAAEIAVVSHLLERKDKP